MQQALKNATSSEAVYITIDGEKYSFSSDGYQTTDVESCPAGWVRIQDGCSELLVRSYISFLETGFFFFFFKCSSYFVVLCPAGAYLGGNNCVACLAGTYQDRDGQTACLSCPSQGLSRPGAYTAHMCKHSIAIHCPFTLTK